MKRQQRGFKPVLETDLSPETKTVESESSRLPKHEKPQTPTKTFPTQRATKPQLGKSSFLHFSNWHFSLTPLDIKPPTDTFVSNLLEPNLQLEESQKNVFSKWGLVSPGIPSTAIS